MKQKTRDLKAGELFIVSGGSYSDYQVEGLFRCKKDFNPDDMAKEFYKTSLRYGSDTETITYFQSTKYLAHLISAEYLEAIPVFEFHYNDYGDYSPYVKELVYPPQNT